MKQKAKNIDPADLAYAPDSLPGGLKCVFSEKRSIKIGTGTTTRKHDMDVYWYVEQLGPETFAMWTIGPKGVPVGERLEIQKAQLLTGYYPELRHYNEKVAPRLHRLMLALARGDKHRKKAEFEEATEQYEGALAIDEKNVRAVFGLGISHLGMGDLERARIIFNDLIELNAAFSPEHKHLFNEMAISLRKSGMHAEAVGLYERAMELTQEDENLLYNISRVYFEQGDWSGCADYLGRCLALHGAHKLGKDLARLLAKMVEDAPLREQHGMPRPTPDQMIAVLRLES